jgi:hypothetical protein
MGIDHVIVVGKSADQQRLVVLSVDALVKNPALMQTYGSGYKWATVFWNVVGAIMFLGSIACSFLWHWWAFIAGFVLAVMILKATRRSKADFVVAMLATNREARAHFVEQGLIWEAPTQSIVSGSVASYPAHLAA